MNNKVRVILVGALILIGINFIYSHVTTEKVSREVSPENQTYWKFKYYEDGQLPQIRCKSFTLYTVMTTCGFEKIAIDNTIYNMEQDGYRWKAFEMFFDHAVNFRILPRLQGLYRKSSEVEIWVGEKYKSCPRLVVMDTTYYSSSGIPVSNGTKINVDRQEEFYAVGNFVNDKLVKEWKVTNRDQWWFRFYGPGEIKFRAMEKYFAMLITKEVGEQMKVSYGASGQTKEKYMPAYYLKAGETTKTPFYLDSGDVVFFPSNINQRLEFSTGGGWRRMTSNFEGNFYRATSDGFLQIKANEATTIWQLSITHKQKWDLQLQGGQSKRINIAPGDIIQSYSRERYFVGNQVMDRDVSYTHTGQNYLEFKGGVSNSTIEVRVLSRRGY